MLRHATAHHPHLDGRVEQDQVNATLGRGERGFVLGVEMPRVAQFEDARPSAARHADRAKGRPCRCRGAPQVLERRGGGLEHRADQVLRAGSWQGQDVRDQQAVGELYAFLVRQRPRALGVHFSR